MTSFVSAWGAGDGRDVAMYHDRKYLVEQRLIRAPTRPKAPVQNVLVLAMILTFLAVMMVVCTLAAIIFNPY